MKPETTRRNNDIPYIQNLYMAIELSEKKWKLGFTIGFGQSPRLRDVDAQELAALAKEIRQAKERFGMVENAPVYSCYEAGRDGFWLHRYLVAQGVNNLVVDSSSIEVNRRKRRVKTDRMDVGKLLTMLIRYHQGEKKVWSIVHVPSREDEDQRQMHRELMALKAEQTHHTNRIKGLLTNQGVELLIKKDFLSDLETVRLWDGTLLPTGLQVRLMREYERYELVKQQINQLELERDKAVRTSTAPAVGQVRQLLKLKGIGMNSAWVYVMEFFAWRGFRNRREVGSLAGLTPTPYQSGDSAREQGISKAGNRRIRAMAIEIACLRQYRRYRWSWLRYQPDSKLSRWYQGRFGKGNSRVHRIGIVALARRLLVELWQYLETGAIPDGARLKTARSCRHLHSNPEWNRIRSLTACAIPGLERTTSPWCKPPARISSGFSFENRKGDGAAP